MSAAVDVFRDQGMLASGPGRRCRPAMSRFMLDGVGLQGVDAIDVTDPTVLMSPCPICSGDSRTASNNWCRKCVEGLEANAR